MKNTAWGNRAYKEARKNCLSKEEAKQKKIEATEKYYEKVKEQQFKNNNYDLEDLTDFNNSKNSGSWHTAEDL